MLSSEQLERLIRLPLESIDREFPNKPGHVYSDSASIRRPRELTPAFFGSFDWHSAVHGHWTLVRALRCDSDLSIRDTIRRRLDDHLTAERLRGELRFFECESNRLFERPYGWGWLLLLHAEMASWADPDAERWAAALEPLSRLLEERFTDYLTALPMPIRAGTHTNSAFSMANALDAARVLSYRDLEQAVRRRAVDFYADDRDYPVAWEPSGEDFISPALAEADLMRRVLSRDEFAIWLGRFVPEPDSEGFARLREPVRPADPTDPRIGHLIGLDFHRAWCFGGLARHLADGDLRVPLYQSLARRHLDAGLEQIFDSGYGGAHWLATFAVYALTAVCRRFHTPNTRQS